MAILETYKYESDDGTVHAIRLNGDTAAAAGTEPTGGINSNIKAKVSKGNGEFGIRPRRVGLSRVLGTAPNQYRVYRQLPVFTLTDYISPLFTIGASVTIGDDTWFIISKQGEDF